MEFGDTYFCRTERQLVNVEGGMVTFQWLGHYLYVSQQTVTLEKFLSDFTRVEARP